MTSKKPSRRELLELCGELSSEDGVPPLEWTKETGSRGSKDRKNHQLCGQVMEILTLTLAGAQDPLLRELMPWKVEPAPDASHLLVLLVPGDERVSLDADAVATCLGRASGLLRREVANAIHRRRAPELTIRFLGGAVMPSKDGGVDE